VEDLARFAGVPVINALSDREHPCQALADLFTLWERGLELRTLRFAWIGDGNNNVCHSLMLLGALSGSSMAIASPLGYAPDPEIQALAGSLGGRFELTEDPRVAARGADVLYTDVWVSMGQEAEREERLRTFARYQLNEPLLGLAKPGALVMHCLPAHRGEEITDSVLDGPQSIVLDQAENRLHVQKAVLLSLLGAGDV
jgi:ornithine carbamoyltransferase